MPRADRDPLIVDIKRNNPTKLVVTLRDGESRTLAISSKSNRWERLLETLSALPWDTIECLNASNETLGIIEAERDIDDEPSGRNAELRQMASVLLDVMKTTQKNTAAQYDAQMAAFLELSSNVMSSVRAMSESYSLAMKVQAAAAATAAVPEGDGGDMLKLVQMGMSMLPTSTSKPAPRPQLQRARPKPAEQAQPPKAAVSTNGVS